MGVTQLTTFAKGPLRSSRRWRELRKPENDLVSKPKNKPQSKAAMSIEFDSGKGKARAAPPNEVVEDTQALARRDAADQLATRTQSFHACESCLERVRKEKVSILTANATCGKCPAQQAHEKFDTCPTLGQAGPSDWHGRSASADPVPCETSERPEDSWSSAKEEGEPSPKAQDLSETKVCNPRPFFFPDESRSSSPSPGTCKSKDAGRRKCDSSCLEVAWTGDSTTQNTLSAKREGRTRDIAPGHAYRSRTQHHNLPSRQARAGQGRDSSWPSWLEEARMSDGHPADLPSAKGKGRARYSEFSHAQELKFHIQYSSGAGLDIARFADPDTLSVTSRPRRWSTDTDDDDVPVFPAMMTRGKGIQFTIRRIFYNTYGHDISTKDEALEGKALYRQLMNTSSRKPYLGPFRTYKDAEREFLASQAAAEKKAAQEAAERQATQKAAERAAAEEAAYMEKKAAAEAVEALWAKAIAEQKVTEEAEAAAAAMEREKEHNRRAAARSELLTWTNAAALALDVRGSAEWEFATSWNEEAISKDHGSEWEAMTGYTSSRGSGEWETFSAYKPDPETASDHFESAVSEYSEKTIRPPRGKKKYTVDIGTDKGRAARRKVFMKEPVRISHLEVWKFMTSVKDAMKKDKEAASGDAQARDAREELMQDDDETRSKITIFYDAEEGHDDNIGAEQVSAAAPKRPTRSLGTQTETALPTATTILIEAPLLRRDRAETGYRHLRDSAVAFVNGQASQLSQASESQRSDRKVQGISADGDLHGENYLRSWNMKCGLTR